jgi:hypothetical protein
LRLFVLRGYKMNITFPALAQLSYSRAQRSSLKNPAAWHLSHSVGRASYVSGSTVGMFTFARKWKILRWCPCLEWMEPYSGASLCPRPWGDNGSVASARKLRADLNRPDSRVFVMLLLHGVHLRYWRWSWQADVDPYWSKFG